MALQSPFFNNNKRDAEGGLARPGMSPNAQAAAGAQQQAAAAAAAAQPATQAAAQPAAKEGESKLTVGPNIKLKGVEITDCDTLVVEGSVEATMDSRVMQISERGTFKGSAEIDIAEISGQFDGNLTVREKLTIRPSGKVTGRIVVVKKLIVEEGGQLSGEVAYGNTAPARDRAAMATTLRGGLQQVHTSVG